MKERKVFLRTSKLKNGNSILKQDRDDLGFFRNASESRLPGTSIYLPQKNYRLQEVVARGMSTECVAVTWAKLPQPWGSAAPHSP